MIRSSPFLWFSLLIILLLPTAAGRVLLDLAGGLMIVIFLIPLLFAGAGWIGWRILQSQMTLCDVCGARLMSKSIQCPICGSDLSKKNNSDFSNKSIKNSIPASSATIDITPKEINTEKDT